MWLKIGYKIMYYVIILRTRTLREREREREFKDTHITKINWSEPERAPHRWCSCCTTTSLYFLVCPSSHPHYSVFNNDDHSHIYAPHVVRTSCMRKLVPHAVEISAREEPTLFPTNPSIVDERERQLQKRRKSSSSL